MKISSTLLAVTARSSHRESTAGSVAALIRSSTADGISGRRVLSLRLLRENVAREVPHLVFLFDSLDRVTNADGFEKLVMEHVRVLRSLGIGVVLVGPLKLLYGTYRPITQRFDTPHQVQWSDPDDSVDREFLLTVLKARAPMGLLSNEGAARLVELSGGVLRDLVGLARNAGEEAYLSGDQQITTAHSEAAGEAFGRTLLLGLGPDDIAKLQAVRTADIFGRVILRGPSPPR